MKSKEKRLEILNMLIDGKLTEQEALMKIKKICYEPEDDGSGNDNNKAFTIIDINDQIEDKIQGEIKRIIAEILRIKIIDIDAEDELFDYGFDSFSFTELASEINKLYDLDLSRS